VAIAAETEGLAVLAQNAAYQRHNYEQEQASAWLLLADTKANETIKKAMVTQKVGALKLDAELAEAMVDAKRAMLRSLYAQADLLRSLMATARKFQDDVNG
jgi:hypothetical protein